MNCICVTHFTSSFFVSNCYSNSKVKDECSCSAYDSIRKQKMTSKSNLYSTVYFFHFHPKMSVASLTKKKNSEEE